MTFRDTLALSKLEFKIAREALARARIWRNSGATDVYQMELRLAAVYRDRAKHWMKERAAR